MNNISDRLYDTFEDSGVSPVIGVILMVAVTVALVALVTVVVFDIGSDVSESPDATVELVNDDGTVEATVLRNENVKEFKIRYEDGTTQSIGNSAGDRGTIEEGSGTYQIIAVMNDGSEQVLQTKEYESVNVGATVSGTVSINPPIQGATVKALDSSGNVLATDTTDSEGKYSFKTEGIDSVKVISDGATFVDEGTTKKLYGIIKKQKTSENLDIDFDQTKSTESDFDGDGTYENVTWRQDENGNYLISSVAHFQNIENKGLGKDYKLVDDIDASGTSSWNSNKGFDPIGDKNNAFTGTLDGNDYSISGIYIDRDTNRKGLFGKTNSGANIKNVKLKNVDIKGSSPLYIGALVGQMAGGTVEKSYSTGVVNGDSKIGGLVGDNSGTIKQSYSTVTVNGDRDVGGLVGSNFGGTITNSYATGDVSDNSELGGLVGDNAGGTITNSYATGSVTGYGSDKGGLIGINTNGINDGTTTDSYWDTESTGQTSSAGSSTGLTTSEMQGTSASSNMGEFDFTNTWTTVTGDYPELSWQE